MNQYWFPEFFFLERIEFVTQENDVAQLSYFCYTFKLTRFY